MKTAVGIFLACYAIFFVAGYFHGQAAAEARGPEEYLAGKVEYVLCNDEIYLVYYDESSDSIRYSLDSNKLVDRPTWLMLKEHAVSTGNSNSKLIAGGVVVTGGGLIVSKFDKIISVSYEQAANKKQGLVAGILGAIAGYWSGFEYGKYNYEPDEAAIPTAKMLADTNFWKQAEYTVFDRYCNGLLDNLGLYILTHETDTAWIREKAYAIVTLKHRILTVAAQGNRDLNTNDFDQLVSMSGLPPDFFAFRPDIEDSDLWSWMDILKSIFLVLFGIGCVIVALFLLSYAVKAFQSGEQPKKRLLKVEVQKKKPKAVKKGQRPGVPPQP